VVNQINPEKLCGQVSSKLRDFMSKFIRVKCNKCNNEQILFEKLSTNVDCLVCNEKLAQSTGGKAKILGTILK